MEPSRRYSPVFVAAYDEESAKALALIETRNRSKTFSDVNLYACHKVPDALVFEAFTSLIDDISGKDESSSKYNVNLIIQKTGTKWEMSLSEIDSVDDLREAIADRDRQIQELVARYEWGQQLIEELKAQRDK
jgi:hypothetical protein